MHSYQPEVIKQTTGIATTSEAPFLTSLETRHEKEAPKLKTEGHG
jgi:hypothetical protein